MNLDHVLMEAACAFGQYRRLELGKAAVALGLAARRTRDESSGWMAEYYGLLADAIEVEAGGVMARNLAMACRPEEVP